MSNVTADLPVIVIGAGPIGLAAAAELHQREQSFLVLEAGAQSAAAVRSWAHVRLFSPWAEVLSPAGVSVLHAAGWAAPDSAAYPTGEQWVQQYLDPLAAALGQRVWCDQRVIGVARQDRDLVVQAGREEQPFVVHTVDAAGTRSRILARAVIDASGTLSRPNPLGADGYPALGEAALAEHLRYGTLDPVRDRAQYAGRATAVVGAGTSALTALLALTSIATDVSAGVAAQLASGTRIVWVLRRSLTAGSFGGGADDELPRRGGLGVAVHEAIDAGLIEVVSQFRTTSVERAAGRLHLIGSGDQVLEDIDEVVVACGYRPDFDFLSEVRLDLDPRIQAPRVLAEGIDPNEHSCGSVPPHGFEALSSGEDSLYFAGLKSYGRAPSFLAMVGHEQVRSIVAALSGDLLAARTVALTLPDTGVCGGAGLFDSSVVEPACC